MSTADIADFIDSNTGGGAPSFKFNQIGDTLKGTITRLAMVNTTDAKTKEQVRNLVIQVQEDAGDEYSLWVKPSQLLGALSAALKAEGIQARDMAAGDRIAVRWSDQEPTNLSPKKIYEVQYKAAPRGAGISLDEL